MQGLVIFGAGGHAKVVADSVRRLGGWRIEGFVDDVSPGRAGEAFCGARVIGGRSALPALRERGVEAIVLGFGHNQARLALAAELAAAGWRFPSIVDPRASVAGEAALGEGVYVGVGAVVEPGARIGAQTIVNTGAVVCHDADIGAGGHVCPRVCIGGHAVVGRGAWVGIGAVVRDRATIGEWSLVGAGALVLGSLPAGVVAYGQPARVIRKVDS